MPLERLPIDTGSDRGPSYPKPVGMGGAIVPNNLWYQARISSFFLLAHLLRPEQAHYERTERTHPNLLTISRRTTKRKSAEWKGERGGCGKVRAVSDSNISHNKLKTQLTLLDNHDQTLLKRSGTQQQYQSPFPISYYA